MKFKIEASDKNYTLNYFVYYKTSFFGKWKKLRRVGYLKLDDCIKAINEFKEVREKVKKINEELKGEKQHKTI